MSFLSISHVSKRFGATEALQDFSLEIAKGETIALLGASGCGKTTLLRCLAGFEIPDSGTISLDEEILAGNGRFVRPHEREVSLLFQDYALFPHLTSGQNIGLGLSKHPDHYSVEDLLRLVRLEGMAQRYPHQLSGGQQQRVALARALATRPKVLLLDEPFSNLDRLLRTEIRAETAALVRQLNLTTVIVTHDADDAVALADRIAVMDQGRLVGLGTAASLYDNPTTLLVAALFGEINVVEKTDTTCRIIRPEHLIINPEQPYGAEEAIVRTCMPANGRFRLILFCKEKEWITYSEWPHLPGTTVLLQFKSGHMIQLPL